MKSTRAVEVGVLISIAAAGLAPVVRSLRVADLNWCYPYMQYDSYDWIQNGLYWAGVPLRPSFRPPLLSLMISGLWRMGALELLPVLNFTVLTLTCVLLYLFLRERHSVTVAGYAAGIFLANGFVQNHTRWIMPEPYPTLFLVASAYGFYRAATTPRAYVWTGLLLGLGFLLQFATPPAALGYAVAIVFARREHLRRRELWLGAAAAILPAVTWLLVKARLMSDQPVWAPRFLTFSLMGFGVDNVPFYLFAGLALLSIPLAPIYLFGLARALRKRRVDPYWDALLAPLLGILFFFVVVYRWADKRFLFYAFPFAVALLAEGVDAVLTVSKASRSGNRRAFAARVAMAMFFAGAFLWNAIRYPDYGIRYLALTPTRFLEAAVRGKTDLIGNDTFHLRGARVLRIHPSVPSALAGGLFDYSQVAPACSGTDSGHTALLTLRASLDRILPPGAAVGYYDLPGFPPWNSAMLKLGNILHRPIVLPRFASLAIAPDVPGGARLVLRSGPYCVIR